MAHRARVGGPQTQGHSTIPPTPCPMVTRGLQQWEVMWEKMLGGDLCQLQGAGWLGAAGARGLSRSPDPHAPVAGPGAHALLSGSPCRRAGGRDSRDQPHSVHRWTPQMPCGSFPWVGDGGRRNGVGGQAGGSQGPSRPGHHLRGGAAGGAGVWRPSADCIRQSIIDPALVYPWCLISINSSWKELAGDTALSPPPSSFARVFL